MKNIKYLVPFVAGLLLMGISDCDRKEPQPKTELEKLPPPTQEGKYTFGCLVNGKAWVTENSLDVSATYQFDFLNIGASVNNDFFIQTILFHIVSSNLTEGKYYLNNNTTSLVEVLDGRTNCEYITDGIENIGELNVTKFDRNKLIISGTFKFMLEASGCTRLEVTEGRFDLKFTP